MQEGIVEGGYQKDREGPCYTKNTTTSKSLRPLQFTTAIVIHYGAVSEDAASPGKKTVTNQYGQQNTTAIPLVSKTLWN